MTKKLLSEFIGTFTLVFAGTGAIVINDVSGGAVSHVGVAMTFGLVVMAMIYTLGDIGFVVLRLLPFLEARFK